jgi:hypothetical protein
VHWLSVAVQIIGVFLHWSALVDAIRSSHAYHSLKKELLARTCAMVFVHRVVLWYRCQQKSTTRRKHEYGSYLSRWKHAHQGDLAIERLRLRMQVYINTQGKMQLTLKFVIEPLTGKTYKRSIKQEALNEVASIP